MKSPSKLIKSSPFILSIVISISIALAIFFWLAIQRYNSVNMMRHIINDDFIRIESQLDKNIRNNDQNRQLQVELISHLNNYILNSYIIFFVILIAVILMCAVFIFTIQYYRRLANI